MMSFKYLVLVLFSRHERNAVNTRLQSSNSRQLLLELIAGYEPKTLVTDQNALDKDQMAMEKQLALKTAASFVNAKYLFEDGGNSNSFAELTLSSSLETPILQNTVVSGYSQDGTVVRGAIMGDQKVGDTVLKVQYQISEVQDRYVGCRVGALHRVSSADLSGCFETNGTITVGNTLLDYSYVARRDNKNGRTLSGLSSEAEGKMLNCKTCPYRTFYKFFSYYGTSAFGNEWIDAAFEKRATTFIKGNANFSSYDFAARQQTIVKGTVCLNIYQYVIWEMEDAINECSTSTSNSVHAWDQAVAFYTGSSELDEGQGIGYLLHTLADKNCETFRTCGALANQIHGHSKANIDIFSEFKKGQALLLDGKCSDISKVKERVENLMAVPMIQGAIRYAYIRSEMVGDSSAQADGASFAAAVLPLVHYCNPLHASLIYHELSVGSGKPSVSAVKSAFEDNYICLGISCADIGGVWDNVNQKYYDGVGPCVDKAIVDDQVKHMNGIVRDLLISGFAVALVGGVCLLRQRHTRSADMNPPSEDRFRGGPAQQEQLDSDDIYDAVLT